LKLLNLDPKTEAMLDYSKSVTELEQLHVVCIYKILMQSAIDIQIRVPRLPDGWQTPKLCYVQTPEWRCRWGWRWRWIAAPTMPLPPSTNYHHVLDSSPSLLRAIPHHMRKVLPSSTACRVATVKPNYMRASLISTSIGRRICVSPTLQLL